MKSGFRVTTIVAVHVMMGVGAVSAETLSTHRIPALLAAEAADEVVAACGRQGYHETAVVLDADGATIAVLRGDGAGIHTLDSAHDKAYTAVTFATTRWHSRNAPRVRTRSRRWRNYRM